MESRLEELEIRQLHQERAIDDMSSQLIAQQQQIETLTLQVQQLRGLVQSLSSSPMAPPSEEGPPPHY